jgi:hypothetical protein
MSDSSARKKRQPDKKEDLVLTPGGWRSKSKVCKVQPGQHAEVQEGRLKVIDTESGKVIADLGVVGKEDAGAARGGRPMKEAKRPQSTK